MPVNDQTEDKVTMTRWELEKEREHAVIHEKVRQFDELIPKIFDIVANVEKSIQNIPLDMLKCREDLDEDMRKYMHDKFISNSDLEHFEGKLERRMGMIETKVGKATWIVSGFIAAGTFIFYIASHTNIIIQ